MQREDQTLLRYYETMVDWDSRLHKEGPFLVRTLRSYSAQHVLDCGCGTGRHALYLRTEGIEANGCDINGYNVMRAQELALEREIPARFFECNMAELSGVEPGEYDAFMTLGNTLASFGYEKIMRTIRRFGELLRPGGIIIGHVLNYESFSCTDRTETRWSTVGETETIFLKTFHFEPDHVLMVVNLLERTNNEWKTHLSTTKMHFIKREFIEKTLAEAGFGTVTFYGSLSGEPFDVEKSRDLVFVGVRR